LARSCDDVADERPRLRVVGRAEDGVERRERPVAFEDLEVDGSEVPLPDVGIRPDADPDAMPATARRRNRFLDRVRPQAHAGSFGFSSAARRTEPSRARRRCCCWSGSPPVDDLLGLRVARTLVQLRDDVPVAGLAGLLEDRGLLAVKALAETCAALLDLPPPRRGCAGSYRSS
jgi:hypothetical protein